MKKSDARLKVVDEFGACRMTTRMLNAANDLRHAAEMLDRMPEDATGEDFTAALCGAPILRAQSAEIALKALWLIGHNMECGDPSDAPPCRHKLTKLHDALTGNIRNLLAEVFPEIPDPYCPHFPIPYRKGLRTILCEHEDALIKWRYIYEHDGIQFAHVFDEVLMTLIKVGRQLQFQWQRRLQADGVNSVNQVGIR